MQSASQQQSQQQQQGYSQGMSGGGGGGMPNYGYAGQGGYAGNQGESMKSQRTSLFPSSVVPISGLLNRIPYFLPLLPQHTHNKAHTPNTRPTYKLRFRQQPLQRRLRLLQVSFSTQPCSRPNSYSSNSNRCSCSSNTTRFSNSSIRCKVCKHPMLTALQAHRPVHGLVAVPQTAALLQATTVVAVQGRGPVVPVQDPSREHR